MDKASPPSDFKYMTPINKRIYHRSKNLNAIIEEKFSQLKTMASTSKKKQKDTSYFVKINTNKYEYYEGEVDENFHRSGWGLYKYHNDDVFEGEFKNGLRNGMGEYRYKDGWSYIGTWTNDKKSGEGVIISDNKEFSGKWVNDHIESGIKYTINEYKKDDSKNGLGEFNKSIPYWESNKSLNSYNPIYNSSPDTVSHFELDSFQSDESESEDKILEEIKIIREIHNNWKFLDSTDFKFDLELSTLKEKMKKSTNETDINKTTKESAEKESSLCYFNHFKKYFSDDNPEEALKHSIKCHCDVFLSQIIDN